MRKKTTTGNTVAIRQKSNRGKNYNVNNVQYSRAHSWTLRNDDRHVTRGSGCWQCCSICSCSRCYLFLFKASGCRRCTWVLKRHISIVWRAFIWIMVCKHCIYWTKYTDNGLFSFVWVCFRSQNVNCGTIWRD